MTELYNIYFAVVFVANNVIIREYYILILYHSFMLQNVFIKVSNGFGGKNIVIVNIQ